MAAHEKLTGRAAWTGKELEASGDWVKRFEQSHLAEIDAALQRVRRFPFVEIKQSDFPLDATKAILDDVSEELENGRGAVRLRGLPVERYADDDLRRIFWGLGTHLGTALFQNSRGEIMGEVRDETRDPNPTFVKVEEGKVRSSRARSRSTGPLRFHTDRCDVIALLCVRNAKAGGVSKLVSVVTLYNQILERRPDLIDVLCRDFWRSRPEDEDGIVSERVFALPVFGVKDGKITTQYSRTYVEQAQEFPQVPRLTAQQIEAMDLLAELAEENCLYSPFVPGDIQLLNNHVIYHGRTAYDDDATQRQDRLLFRLWFSMPNSRALPEGYDNLWGDIRPGALRGGAPQPDQRRSPLAA